MTNSIKSTWDSRWICAKSWIGTIEAKHDAIMLLNEYAIDANCLAPFELAPHELESYLYWLEQALKEIELDFVNHPDLREDESIIEIKRDYEATIRAIRACGVEPSR